MQEVTIRLKMVSPALGYAAKELGANRGVIYRMPRDGQGRVMFLSSWWLQRMVYAATVVNMYQQVVKAIAWSTVVDGAITSWRRMLPHEEGKRQRYALHEAYRPGTVIGVTAVLPAGLPIDDFVSLLDVVGTYKGISPFQSPTENYGMFEVQSVMPAIRQMSQAGTAARETS